MSAVSCERWFFVTSPFPLNALNLENRPSRSWCYVTGPPGLFFLYFAGASLDFFYCFYNSLLYHFSRGSIRFYVTQTSNKLLCELQILMCSHEDLKELNGILQREGINTEPVQINLYAANVPSHPMIFQPSLFSSFKEEFFYTHSEKYLKKLTRILTNFFSFSENSRTPTIRLHLTKARIETKHEIENALGIVIGVKEQCATREQVLKVIQLLIPSAALLAHSLMHQESEHGLYFLSYFEMTKMRGGPFTFHELRRFRKELPFLLQDRI